MLLKSPRIPNFLIKDRIFSANDREGSTNDRIDYTIYFQSRSDTFDQDRIHSVRKIYFGKIVYFTSQSYEKIKQDRESERVVSCMNWTVTQEKYSIKSFISSLKYRLRSV